MPTNARQPLNKLTVILVAVTSILSIALACMAFFLGVGVVYARF